MTQLGPSRWRDGCCCQSIGAAIGQKDLAKAWRDDELDSSLLQRPNCVLAGRSAAEVLAPQENHCTLTTRPVHRELGQWRATISRISNRLKSPRTKLTAREGSQSLDANDEVRIDLIPQQRYDCTLNLQRKSLQQLPMLRLFSVKPNGFVHPVLGAL
jgi:hypothetical protein